MANSPSGGDVANFAPGTLTGSHNLIETAITGSGSNTLTGTIMADPKLGPLANNGGPTQTMALLAGSPAINAGSNALAVDPSNNGQPLTTDQRGVPFARIAGGTVDIGAYEAQTLHLVVDTTADENNGNYSPGDLSLREAITLANANPGADTISFAIPGAGVHTISLLSALPMITDPVIIDGYTQPGRPNTLAVGDNAVLLIELNGANAGIGVTGLTITAGSSTVSGLVINRFGGDGIADHRIGRIEQRGLGQLHRHECRGHRRAGQRHRRGDRQRRVEQHDRRDGSRRGQRDLGQQQRRHRHRWFPSTLSSNGNFVQGNKIGTNAAGTAALGNGTPGVGSGGAGVRFFGGTFNTVDNNVISGNVNEGIFFHGDLGASHEMVLDNLIGTNAAGTAPIGNGLSGITLNLQTAANTISGNVISGNGVGPSGGNGISLNGGSVPTGPHDNLIQANHIGTNAAGTAALGNTLDGISLNDASSNRIIGNVVSGNGINQDAAGINLESNDSNNIIAGNEIGTNAAGNAMLGNSLHGIFLGNGSSNNTIGGPTDNDRNVISGNGQFPVANSSTQGGVGVYIYGANTSGNVVQRNYIGTNAAGIAALTNSVIGVLINQSGSNTVQGNVISGNQLIGVEIAGGTGGMASGNLVQGNKIGTNAGGTAAIPNGGDGIFINDAPNNVIGGTAAGAGNLISGNGSVGIQLFGTLTRGNVIQGNALGLNAAGRPTLPNRNGGIFVNTSPLANQLGGTGPGQANQGQVRPVFGLARLADPGSTSSVLPFSIPTCSILEFLTPLPPSLQVGYHSRNPGIGFWCSARLVCPISHSLHSVVRLRIEGRSRGITGLASLCDSGQALFPGPCSGDGTSPASGPLDRPPVGSFTQPSGPRGGVRRQVPAAFASTHS